MFAKSFQLTCNVCCIKHMNRCEILVSNFPFLHGRMHTSKLCNIAEVSLGKQQVTSEAQCLPQAGHLLQILRISCHSTKMRCEWPNMTFQQPHVNICFWSHVASISFSLVMLLQVKFKIALCHSALCEHREALQEVPCFSFTFICSF